MSKTHWKSMQDKTFLGSWDFETGKTYTVKITSVKSVEMMAQKGAEMKHQPVTFFEGIKKGMVINNGNGLVISKISGSPYIEDWIGVKITIFLKENERTPQGNQTVIRVSEKKPLPKKKTELTPENKKLWGKAVEALKKGKTINVIKERYKLSKENEVQLLRNGFS